MSCDTSSTSNQPVGLRNELIQTQKQLIESQKENILLKDELGETTERWWAALTSLSKANNLLAAEGCEEMTPSEASLTIGSLKEQLRDAEDRLRDAHTNVNFMETGRKELISRIASAEEEKKLLKAKLEQAENQKKIAEYSFAKANNLLAAERRKGITPSEANLTIEALKEQLRNAHSNVNFMAVKEKELKSSLAAAEEVRAVLGDKVLDLWEEIRELQVKLDRSEATRKLAEDSFARVNHQLAEERGKSDDLANANFRIEMLNKKIKHMNDDMRTLKAERDSYEANSRSRFL